MKSILLSFLLLTTLSGYSQKQINSNATAPSNENASSNGGGGTEKASAIIVPVYPGGERALYKFIGKNIQYPQMARAQKTEGQVIVRFLVDVDGTVKNAIVPEGKGIGNGCDEEAVRVVMSLPKWQPAMRMGTPVAIWYEIPIAFRLTQIN